MILLLVEGLPLAAVAHDLGVHRRTLENWKDRHPAFAAALELGLEVGAEWGKNEEALVEAEEENDR